MEELVDDVEEFSASSTTILFDRPLPLLRGPVLSGRPTAGSSPGPHVLAFRDGGAWKSAFLACESRIAGQCQAAARIGCAMSASSKCKPPWWRNLIGPDVSDLKERGACEEREMERCLAAAREKCSGFAREKCLRSFREARVSNPRRSQSLLCLAAVLDKSFWADLIGLNLLGLPRRDSGVTIYKASELIGRDSQIDCILSGHSVTVEN